MTKNVKSALGVGLWGGLIIGVVALVMGHHTVSMIAIAVSLLANFAIFLPERRRNRVAHARLGELKDVPNPSVTEMKEYRKEHPELTLTEAMAAMKEERKAGGQ